MSNHHTTRSANRPRPQVAIPRSSRDRALPPIPLTDQDPGSPAPYSFEFTPPPYEDAIFQSFDNTQTPTSIRPRVHSMTTLPPRPPSRNATVSTVDTSNAFLAFPEPQLYRSVSQGSTLHPSTGFGHRPSRSDLGPIALHRDPSLASFASYNEGSDYGGESHESQENVDSISRGLAHVSLESEEGLKLFQSGDLPEADQEWYRLVPEQAREALGQQEVQRQSVIFEVFKSEREYVADLEAVQQVYIDALRRADPPVIPEKDLSAFIEEVFGNLNQIVAHHQAMLGALFCRQRDQHPLIQSIADIILDTTLKTEFRTSYEVYIKHYPISESRHRQELKKNSSYRTFTQSVSNDPRIRKRDLITFLSRPVTRLPRLNLLLEQILKRTDKEYEHPDLETLPIILGILTDCVKSTQPGIEAAEGKVKFLELCESLVFQKGEIIDLDRYGDNRTLVYSGPVARKTRSETGWTAWTDLTAWLIDEHFIMTRDEKRSNGSVRRIVSSRPLPLSYLRLGSFTSPPEYRKEKVEEGGIFDGLRSNNVPIYPFTIYHASSRSMRRYTLFVASEAVRKKWFSYLTDAIAVHKASQDANLWFNPQTLTDHTFRTNSISVSPENAPHLKGRITSAVPFSSGGKKYLAVASAGGIYVSLRGEENYTRVLTYRYVDSMAAVQGANRTSFSKLLVFVDSSIVSYSLDLLARVSQKQVQPRMLDASFEKIAGQDASVLFFRYIYFQDKALVVYATKRRLQVTPTLDVLEAVDSSDVPPTPTHSHKTVVHSFKPFGEPGYVPKTAFDICSLSKSIGICTNDAIVIANPKNLAQSSVSVVPDWRNVANGVDMSVLKSQVEDAKPLGIVGVDPNKLLVIYDRIGFYITRHGTPRSAEYIRWETKADSYAHRGSHVLLFSSEFIEVRNVVNSRIVQVIEGTDIRLMFSGPAFGKEDTILVAMRGGKDDGKGVSEKLVELVETTPIPARVQTPTGGSVPAMWDEWDM